jgi:hypothetical protein
MTMSNRTTLKSRYSDKSNSESPEKLQQTIDEQQKTIAMQYDLLQEAVTKNESLLRKVQELEKQLQERQNHDGYNGTSSWISKITFILQQENRPLRSPEMISLLERKSLHWLHTITKCSTSLLF